MSGVCRAEWPNTEIPAKPHRCAIRPGWHVQHCCHCGATRRVTDAEQTHPPAQYSGVESDQEAP